jgi:hypothetical protein
VCGLAAEHKGVRRPVGGCRQRWRPELGGLDCWSDDETSPVGLGRVGAAVVEARAKVQRGFNETRKKLFVDGKVLSEF